MRRSSVRPLPVETARAAKSTFNIENLYLSIGDQLQVLFKDLDPNELDAFGEKPMGALFLLAMVTLFQFAECLPDRQAADAVRTRLDWKSALHLPLDHPGIDGVALREFRHRLWTDTAGQRAFRRMLTHVAEWGLLGRSDKHQADVVDVLAAVDILSQVDEATEAVSLALGALAATQPEWLRTMSLPHWYERYSQTSIAAHLPSDREELDALAHAVRADIAHLLQAIEQADAPDLALLPEVQVLRWMQRQQF
jgi:transposase